MYYHFLLKPIIENSNTFAEIKDKGMKANIEWLSNNKIKEIFSFINTISFNDKKIKVYNYSLWKKLSELDNLNFNEWFICYEEGKKHFYNKYVNNNLEQQDRINNISFQFNKYWKKEFYINYSILWDNLIIKEEIYKMGILNAYIHYEKENFYLFEKYLQKESHETTEITTLPENIDKIQINGNYQLLAFLFNELIEKGYITAPIHNGKRSHKRTAEMLLKHFEFTNKEEQPSVENLTNYIKNNTYSTQKQGLFKIPSIKTAND